MCLQLAAALAILPVQACEVAEAPATPPIVAGSVDRPREVNLIARDYTFVPSVLDLVPGETITLHVINAGLVAHEAVIGDQAVQDAWEAAEAATEGAPPGPTPVVSVAPAVSGVRVVVESGELEDLVWTVPGAAAEGPETTIDAIRWLVGCHIPGHLAKGMQIPIRWVRPQGLAR